MNALESYPYTEHLLSLQSNLPHQDEAGRHNTNFQGGSTPLRPEAWGSALATHPDAPPQLPHRRHLLWLSHWLFSVAASALGLRVRGGSRNHCISQRLANVRSLVLWGRNSIGRCIHLYHSKTLVGVYTYITQKLCQ